MHQLHPPKKARALAKGPAEFSQIYDLLALPARNPQQRPAPNWIANWDKAAAICDERFCRMWVFNLTGSEAAFRYRGLVVFQVQLVKRIDALPLTRDYMADDEQGLLEQDAIDARPRMAGE